MKKIILPALICLMLLFSPSVLAARTVTITSEPSDASGQLGETLSFDIAANGEGILNYIWYLRIEDASTGEPLEEIELGFGSSASLTLSSKMIEDGKKSYVYCLVSDSSGDIVTSRSASIGLSLAEPLAITISYQPSNEITCRVSDELMISAAVSNPEEQLGSLTYRWYRADSTPIRLEGENKPYIVVPTDLAGAYCYYCIVTNEKDGRITESDPSALVRVTVKPSDSIEFEDVSADSWYYSAVKTACASGYFKGRTRTSFCPTESITIAEAVTLSCRLYSRSSGDIAPKNGSPWYSGYMTYALEHGIIDSDLSSSANTPITRGFFARLLALSIGNKALKPTVEVADSSISDLSSGDENSDSIYKLYRAGILTGYEDGSFHPDAPITRAEAAAAVSRIK